MLKSHYCPGCRRYLGKENIKLGMIETQCPGCRLWIVIVASKKETKLVLKNR